MYPVTMRRPSDIRPDAEQRFRDLYEAAYTRILGYALRRTADREDAADVVAATFTIAWQKLDEIPAGPEATLWLYGVARKVLSNHRRKQRSRSAVVEMLTLEYDAAWADPLPGAGEVSCGLAQAWAALSKEDRDLLGLMVWETLTTAQIATVTGCTRAVAKVRVHRARRRFARELERRGYPLKPETLTRHVQVGRAEALPDTEAM
jgi:RNA polymerase sigma-70 factor (ECF subfamily)